MPHILGQCREHWLKVLSPSIKKGKWTADEDKNLMHIMSFGFRNWKIVSELCPGRTSKQVRLSSIAMEPFFPIEVLIE